MSFAKPTSAGIAVRSAVRIVCGLLLIGPVSGCVVISQNMRLPPQLNGPKVAVRQYSTPTAKLPEDVRTLAVAHFGGSRPADVPWAHAAAVHTSNAIAANLRDFPQHGVVLRGGPGGVLGTPPEGPASTTAAADLGRRAGADAVVTANVAVGSDRGHAVLAVQFALVRSRDAHVLDRWEYRGTFGSRRARTGGSDRGGEGTITLHDLLSGASRRQPRRPSRAAPRVPREALPPEAAAGFARRVTPHWRVLSVPLANGGGENGDAGRRAARNGNSLEALLHFRRAVRTDDRDPGAWYNLAVIYEARAEFKQARNAYRETVDIYDTVDFRRGLQRTERELQRRDQKTVVKD